MREPCGCPQKPSLHGDRRVRESTKASVPSSLMVEKWKQTVTTRKLIKIHKTVEGEKPTKNEVWIPYVMWFPWWYEAVKMLSE